MPTAKTMIEINSTLEGFEKLKENIEYTGQGTNFYPLNQVDVTVGYDSYGDREVTGTLLDFRGSLTQDEEKREENRYNGWFGKILLETGMLNVYADPNHGGDHVIFVKDWQGKGRRPYKYPISSIEIEERDKDPYCKNCGDELTFGWLNNAREDQGTHRGWICESCSARMGGKLEEYEVGKLP